MAKKTKTNLPKGKDIVVFLKPGTAAEKSLKFLLPEEKTGKSVLIDSIIKYGLWLKEEDGITRYGLRIQERLRTEMTNKYGISVNGRSVSPDEPLAEHLKEKTTTAGRKYLEAQVIVASRQEGAGNIEYLME